MPPRADRRRCCPTFGRYPLRNDDDTAWQAKLSPDGSMFVLSDADTIGAKQTA